MAYKFTSPNGFMVQCDTIEEYNYLKANGGMKLLEAADNNSTNGNTHNNNDGDVLFRVNNGSTGGVVNKPAKLTLKPGWELEVSTPLQVAVLKHAYESKCNGFMRKFFTDCKWLQAMDTESKISSAFESLLRRGVFKESPRNNGRKQFKWYVVGYAKEEIFNCDN